MRTSAHVLGESWADIILVILRPALYVAVYRNVTMGQAPYGHLFIVALLVSWWCSGFGYLLSVVLPREHAMMAAVVSVLIFSLLSGLDAPLLGTAS